MNLHNTFRNTYTGTSLFWPYHQAERSHIPHHRKDTLRTRSLHIATAVHYRDTVRQLKLDESSSIAPTPSGRSQSLPSPLAREDFIMASKESIVRKTSLYRLAGVSTDADAFEGVIIKRYRENPRFQHEYLQIGGCESFAIWGSIGDKAPDWLRMARSLTSLDIDARNETAAGVVLVRVDDCVYALSFGMGHVLLDTQYIEPAFGLEFTLRAVESKHVRQVTKSVMDERGRSDRSSVTGGASIKDFGIEEYGEIVSRIAGRLMDLDVSGLPLLKLTYMREGNRRIHVAGVDALKIPLGIEAQDLIADLREITRARDDLPLADDFDDVAQVRPLKKGNPFAARLDTSLDAMLLDPAQDSVSCAIPADCRDYEGLASSYRIRFGRRQEVDLEELDIDTLAASLDGVNPNGRLAALRGATIQLLADDSTGVASRMIPADRWIVAESSLDSSRFFLHEGRWYQIGSQYSETLLKHVEEIFDQSTTLSLPPWLPAYKEEKDYNEEVPGVDTRLLCLDRNKIITSQHPNPGIEVADLLGPGNELIHVKRADRSTSLSHLFSQGIISADALCGNEEAREKFAAKVSALDPNRGISESWTPKTVIYAIRHSAGRTITADSLFTFSRVSLLRATSHLKQRWNIRVEIINIGP